MHFNSVVFSALALLGVSHAAPVAEPEPAPVPATLPAPPAVQNQIIGLQATIVYLTNDIVQTNAANGKKDWNQAKFQFDNLAEAVLTPPDTCPPPTANGRITTAQNAIVALNTTQNNLSQLSLDLQNAGSSRELILNDYCNAFAPFGSVQYYIFNILGTSKNGASNAPVANFFNAAGYDPNKLGQTYTASLVALEALITALNNIPKGQPSTTDAKTAFKNARGTLDQYRAAANPTSSTACAAVKLVPAKDSPSAIDYTKIVEQTVQSVYADTTADNGKAFGDFCKINTYMVGINSYVQAA